LLILEVELVLPADLIAQPFLRLNTCAVPRYDCLIYEGDGKVPNGGVEGLLQAEGEVELSL
jgi:hypothetical protein